MRLSPIQTSKTRRQMRLPADWLVGEGVVAGGCYSGGDQLGRHFAGYPFGGLANSKVDTGEPGGVP